MANNDALLTTSVTSAEQSAGRNGVVVPVAAGQTVTADSQQLEVFVIHAAREDVANFARQGNDLVVEFVNGQTLTVRGFFAGAGANQLVFMDGGHSYRVDFAQALSSVGDGIDESRLSWFTAVETQGSMGWLWALLGLLAVGGAVALANDDDSSSNNNSPPPAPAPSP
ncbi:MAG: BapA prefix-like domain-containing protein, partial [Pseudomonadales bacterium]|nr:BapA prefix-like domain-containing protein [Pseudomonadales bacterium]